jgi:ubiquinone/menaquinone biosynthesis C-methylase UbiE
MSTGNNKTENFINPADFSGFTCSKKSHCDLFSACGYDIELFGERYDPLRDPIKRYQDLLVFSFIKQVVPKGAKLLDVGGGDSRIIEYFKKDYECWNVDKLEGCGNGPNEIDTTGFHLVKDYMGNFNPELPDGYFDFVFSISALEHVPQNDTSLFANILEDLNRTLKPGGYSLHCLDSMLRSDRLQANGLLYYLFKNERTLNPFIPFEELKDTPGLLFLPENIYNERWLPCTKKTYSEFGKPFSYNILRRKSEKTASIKKKEATAIFIHSLFRTGSTYLWNKFRQDEKYYCYYEPLHQFLTKVTTENIHHIMTGDYKSVHHPVLDKYYLYEYKPLLKEGLTGIPFFRKSFSFENFCLSDTIPGLKRYLDYLIDGAQDKIPTLQFNRSAFRISWFKKTYPGSLNIYMLRAPRDQWQSYFELNNRTGYRGFFVMDLLIPSINKNSGEYKLLAEILPLMDFHNEKQEKEDEFYRIILDSYSNEEKYLLFYYTWFKALIENALHADFIININLLSDSLTYREKVTAFLSGRGFPGKSFEDTRIKEYSSYSLPIHVMDKIEAEVRETILGALPGEQIDRFFKKLPQEDKDYFRFDIKDFKRKRKPNAGAGSAISEKTIGKLKKMVEIFAAEYFERVERNRILENQVQKIDAVAKQKDRQIEEKNRALEEKGKQINQKEQAILKKENELRQINLLLLEKDSQLTEIKEQFAQAGITIRRIRNSYTYRVGKITTFPFRIIKKLFTKFRKKSKS